MFGELKKDSMSETSLKLRRDFFIPNQKLDKLRYFFNNVTTMRLTDDELQNIKQVIVKPKSANWPIIQEIIKYQHHLTSEQIVEWFNCIKEHDRLTVSMSMIENKWVKDDALKLELAAGMLKHINYIRPLIRAVDNATKGNPLELPAKLWDDIFLTIIDAINSGDTMSSVVAKIYTMETKSFDSIAKRLGISSLLLYQYTGLDQYLPQEAKDIFMF